MLEQIATLQEIETSWSLTDLLDANEALDCWQEARNEQAKRDASKGQKKP